MRSKRQAAEKAASATGRPNKRCFQIKKFFEPAMVPQDGQRLSSLGWPAWAGKSWPGSNNRKALITSCGQLRLQDSY